MRRALLFQRGLFLPLALSLLLPLAACDRGTTAAARYYSRSGN